MLAELKPLGTAEQDSPESIGMQLSAAEQYLTDGKWRKAEKLCEEILRQHQDAAAVSLLGRIYRISGQRQRAVEQFRKAVVLDAANASHWFELASVLQAQDWHATANAWLTGIQIDPSRLEAHLGLADSLVALELYDSALIAARQALLVDPSSKEAYDRMGFAAAQLGDRYQAIDAYTHSLSLKPDCPETLRRLADIHRAEGNGELAREILTSMVQLRPRDAGSRFELAGLLGDLGARREAIDQLKEAIRLQPHFPEALSNLGLLLRAEREFADAERCYKKACGQKPDFAVAWNNLANLCLELGRLDDAERHYSKAIGIDAGNAEAHTSRAMLRLLNGDFERGWDEYEWRWQQRGLQPRTLPQPAWDGSSLAGKTILLHTEQGAGDTLQFIRYARVLKQQGASVILHCPATLRDLLQAMPDMEAVFAGQETAPNFDVHAPLMSLPRLLGTRVDSIPAEIPYLQVPENVVVPESLRQSKGPSVGLVWSGNPSHPNDRNRSIPAASFECVLEVEDLSFFSLQVGGPSSDEVFPSRPIVDLAPELHSYAITAACLDHLDLLITVDTSTAHLAGALGRPVWLLLPLCNDFRWLRGRSDSPWYPSMRVFRQKTLGDWTDVLREVVTELRSWSLQAAESRSKFTEHVKNPDRDPSDSLFFQ